MLAALILAAAAAACSLPEAALAAQMGLSYEAFDGREGDDGWRSLNGAGCTDAAVALLNRYGAANAGRMSGEQRRELAFHIGQTLAFAGRKAQAIPAFEQADAPEASAEWRAYVAATLAFLRGDASALRAARGRYAAVASGSMRLRMIDGFIACPDADYMTAAFCPVAP
ncbi:MAG: hypothetical protein KA220_07155 [Phenylobacterium sp.]|nr:hypothetical protein [Phenylobacterium sp.]MBP8246624.1 hypothetical protein [Phenylobacterium sp.]